jgi:ribosomal protein S18 acetylase RimI-like enzyme
MRDVSIRNATSEDAALIAELGLRIFVETFGASNSAEDMRAYVATAFDVERMRDEITDPLSMVFVAETDGNPVGFARLHAGPPPAEVAGNQPVELARLYVAGAQHGTGVGARLMQHCIDVARGRGHDVMHLGVWEHNARAIAFYRKHGFAHVGEHTFMLGSDAQTDWTMTLSLT